jgi:outer membrane receptor protein involved in Fe transport
MASLALSYRLDQHSRLALNLLYNSRRNLPEGYQSLVDPASRDAGNADAFVLVDFSAARRVNRHFSVELRVRNVFDEEVFSPSIENPAEYDSQWPGRSVGLYLTGHF